MKVYVITSAYPMQPEGYEGVAKSFKDAEKFIRSTAPNARRNDSDRKGTVSYTCKDPLGHWLSMFIDEEELS